ncbi:myosin-14-like [Canna indica]|uniref:Myosin-14-like n=1 Tax=Canna indica TaxID=4628 RepID=A0AAQ3Q1S3_9LILI|nr:myosin-14-like [Canna indica]
MSLTEQKHSESGNSLLKSEVDIANQKLEKMNRNCEELELEQKSMSNETLEAEYKYTLLLGSLQEALTEKDIKHSELLEVKEAFARLTFELESLRKQAKDLQEELMESSNEMQKHEELSKHSGSKAELELKRALEFEKTLESTQYKVKEMEGQMDNLQKELNGLYEKIAQNQHVQGVLLRNNSVKMSTIQEKLELSRSRTLELEQKLVSKDAMINDLTLELHLHLASEGQLKANIVELESLLSASKEELQKNRMKLEETELKLEEKEQDKERIETSFKNQLLWHKATLESLQKDLSDLTREKVTLQRTVGDLNLKLSMNEELRTQLEAKLNLADQNLNKTDSLLSQALTHNKEFEQKQKYLEYDIKKVRDTATKKILELEDLVHTSKLAEDSIKKKLRESEMRLSSSEKHNMELKQQIHLTEIRCLEAESEIEELNDQVKQLTTLLRKIDEENSLSRRRFQGYENRIGQLESSLNRSFCRNTELEKELNNLLEKSAENERDTTTHEGSLQLEDEVQSSHFKSEHALREVGELEVSLETASYRKQELEQLLISTEGKFRNAEAEEKQYSSKVSALFDEIEAYQARSSSLEAVLRATNEKERKLTDTLNATIKERKNIEDLYNIKAKNLAEAENLIQILQTKLKSLGSEIESAEKELEASNLREKELVEKLRYSGEQLKDQGMALEEVTAINLEMKLQHESLMKDSEFKLKEIVLKFNQNESEVKELRENLMFLEEHRELHNDQAVQATEKAALLKAELEENAIKLISLENKVEELNQKLLESNLKAEDLLLENEAMAQANSKLWMDLETCQLKIDELNQLLDSNHEEMEENVVQLASLVKTIAKLADENTRYLELQSVTESHLKETEIQLYETIEKLKQKGSEVIDLNEKLLVLETQLRNYEEQASESAVIASSQKDKLADTLLKVQNLDAFIEKLQRNFDESKTVNEQLTRENQSLSQELSSYTTKLKDLQIEFDVAAAEKEVISIHLQSSKKEMEVIHQQLNSHWENHQLQIASDMEERDKLTEMYQKEKTELKAIIIHLKEQLHEQKNREVSLNAHVENLKVELADKSLMQDQITELEKKLLIAQKSYTELTESIRTAVEKEATLTSKLKEHISLIKERDILVQQLKNVQNEVNLVHKAIEKQKIWESRKEIESKASMNQSPALLEAKYKHGTSLEKQIEQFEQKLQHAEPQYNEKVEEENKKLAFINTELTKLRHRHGETLEPQKIEEHNKLKLANTKMEDEQVQKVATETELKDALEVKSRDLRPDSIMILCKGSKKDNDFDNHALRTTSLKLTTGVDEDPSGAMASKFILGVALVSMIIGIILGKRY